jgi:hypothetical protein
MHEVIHPLSSEEKGFYANHVTRVPNLTILGYLYSFLRRRFKNRSYWQAEERRGGKSVGEELAWTTDRLTN